MKSSLSKNSLCWRPGGAEGGDHGGNNAPWFYDQGFKLSIYFLFFFQKKTRGEEKRTQLSEGRRRRPTDAGEGGRWKGEHEDVEGGRREETGPFISPKGHMATCLLIVTMICRWSSSVNLVSINLGVPDTNYKSSCKPNFVICRVTGFCRSKIFSLIFSFISAHPRKTKKCYI